LDPNPGECNETLLQVCGGGGGMNLARVVGGAGGGKKKETRGDGKGNQGGKAGGRLMKVLPPGDHHQVWL